MSTAPTLARYTLRAMEKIAPLRLAEKWDNVGLLLESPVARPEANRVLLTIDLTPSVLEEALHPSTALVISYHPPIFKPLSSITLANSLQTSILKLAAVGVSVYSPHTALDSVRGGINDFLASGLVNIEASVPAGTVHEIERAGEVKFLGGVTKEEDEGGLGRLVELHRETPIEVVVERIKGHLGLNYVDLARPLVPRQVRTIAVCAGSGGSVLASVNADVFFTGEMSHVGVSNRFPAAFPSMLWLHPLGTLVLKETGKKKHFPQTDTETVFVARSFSSHRGRTICCLMWTYKH
ncbi:GTP cyclohydrolase 1 type 2/Nif3 [Pisolithus croceorrhizus]|nr:GTP cyclohydrolase 1 type 2/Nif3 [Pisolithus croceorrhizus]